MDGNGYVIGWESGSNAPVLLFYIFFPIVLLFVRCFLVFQWKFVLPIKTERQKKKKRKHMLLFVAYS